MSTTKRGRPPASKKTDKAAASDATYDTMIRGLTADDVAALERATARRQTRLDAAVPGGVYLSRNAVLLSLLRAAMAAEDAEDAKGSPS